MYFGFRALLYFHVVVLPLLLGLFVAALLEPVVSWVQKLLPRGLAALVAVLLGLGLLVGAAIFVGARVASQLSQAGGFVERGLGKLAELLPGAPDQGDAASNIGARLTHWFTAHGTGVASEVASGAMAVFLVGSQTLLTLAFSFFMLRDGPALFDGMTGRLKDTHQEEQARAMARRAWGTLGRYLRGVSLIALLNSLEKGLALWILSIPMAIPIMVLTFVGSFVPLAGPIIAGAVAGLVALASSGLTTALLIIAAAFLIQIIEGNVLQPFILGRTMRLQPILILGAVAFGAILAGLAGAFLAVPILAAARSALDARSDLRAS